MVTKNRRIWRGCGWTTVSLFVFGNIGVLGLAYANQSPVASLSLQSGDENQTLCFPAGSVANDPDGEVVLINDVEGTTEGGQQRLATHLSIYPLESEFYAGELISR